MYLAKIKTENATESHFIVAKSYTEAEAVVAKNFPSASVLSLNTQSFAFVLKSDRDEDDRFFKCRVMCIGEDGSKSNVVGLIQCDGAESCMSKLAKEIKEWISDCCITSVSDTRAVSIIEEVGE